MRLCKSIDLLADKGYQGIAAFHQNSFIPIKKMGGRALSPLQRAYNRELAKLRIAIEHVNACLKRFRILAGPYRNRRAGFGRRFNLIAALYNLGLTHSP